MENSQFQRVAILMSTYNGEKYVRKQVDSILSQKGVNLDLYIRDDGSTDNTPAVLREYEKKNDNVFLLDGDRNMGPGMSFIWMFYEIMEHEEEYDYYAFADQDDIWLDNKVSSAIQKLEEKDNPALYCSNQTIYRNNQTVGLRFVDTPDLSLKGHISKNNVSGCTMIMNRALAEYAYQGPIPPKRIIEHRLHDSWFFLVALLAGEVIFDNQSYILYRIHEANVVGLKSISFIERIRRIFIPNKGQSKIMNLRSDLCRVLLSSFQDIDPKDRKVLEEFAYYRNDHKRKVELLLDKEIYRASGENGILFMFKVLINYV